MPLTPFAGLSVLVHVLIIVGHKLLRFMPWRGQDLPAKPVSAPMRFLAPIIIAFIFTVVLTTATVLVRASVADEHSSVRFVGAYVARATTYVYTQSAADARGNLLRTLVPRDCLIPFLTLAEPYKGSLINYLSAKGYPSSFDAREKFAHELGIMNYSGTYDQNQVILMRFFLKLNELPALGSPPCKN